MANNLKTYGDLKSAIKTITTGQRKEKVGGVSINTIIGQIPIIGNIKTGVDLVRAFVEAPDTKKTKTWLDKLQIDDNMSKIIDNAVENGFIQYVSKEIESQQDSKPLEQDFNMNQKLVDFLKNNYQGRTVTGIKENKMKKSQLEQLIKEEIKKAINEIETPNQTNTIQGSFKADLFKKLMGTSFDSAKFTSVMNKLKNNQARSATDNAFLGDVVRALMYTDDNVMLNNIFNYLKTLKTKPKA